MPSAISTPTYQAVNANIANDGSADSPRGFGSVTSTGNFTMTATGPSLYRVVVSSPAAPITAVLPTTVKAGYRCRIEVELTSSTETNCFFTSPAIAEAQINGTGFVELMALQDNPTLAAHWKVVDVWERSTSTFDFTTGFGSTGSGWTDKSLICSRRNAQISIAGESWIGVCSGSGILSTITSNASVVPARFCHSSVRVQAAIGYESGSVISVACGVGILNTGVVQLLKTSAAWLNVANTGFYYPHIAYVK